MTKRKISPRMVTIVQNQEHANMIGELCKAAGSTQNLQLMKWAVIIAESLKIVEPEEKTVEPEGDKE